ncbi:MoeA, N-terminal and linker domain-containing protein [Coniochaeta sp. 2T2.1]|nr:MoeA, N-terminal and linker domain-containing protein [Coniochaeta sp. 2T2.1]
MTTSTSHAQALQALLTIARTQRASKGVPHVSVPLTSAVGGVLAKDVVAPLSTPEHDTSALDGYAVQSAATATASRAHPVRLRVRGRIAAGDEGVGQVVRPEGEKMEEDGQTTDENGDNMSDVSFSCHEITTGAIFPPFYDACIRHEDVVLTNTNTHILITNPVSRGTNKRFAATDILKSTLVLCAGTALTTAHILPLSSLGFTTVPLVPKPRIAVFSTGKELLCGQPDVNGPFLMGALRGLDVRAEWMGVLPDDSGALRERLEEAVSQEKRDGGWDVVLTSGGVSMGAWDYVPDVVKQMRGRVVWHGVGVRPGFPVFCALLREKETDGAGERTDGGEKTDAGRKTVMFGLPGNPGAAAACFRFLVVPYLRWLMGLERETPIIARLDPEYEGGRYTANGANGHGSQSEKKAWIGDVFRHGILRSTAKGELIVRLSEEQSPAKLGPFVSANCWIHFPPPEKKGEERLGDGLVECYSIDGARGVIPVADGGDS